MPIRRFKDCFAGIMFLFFGAAAMFFSVRYQIGTAARMGPGYFPFALGLLLALLGIALIAASLGKTREKQAPPSFQVKPLALILLSVVMFGLMLRPLGLLLSTVILVVTASYAGHEFRWKEAILNAAVLVAIVFLIFVYFLDFQVPIRPWFLPGRI
ncbi:MAG: tripartite tricarboxylate transporter TctB family protein [Thermodesulfobacteriota bacterium]